MKMIIQETTFEKAKSKINKSSEKYLIFTSNDDDLNRKVLEKLSINTLLLNQKDRKDFQKQRNSGLNHILAKIAKKNKIEIGINLDEIIEAKNKSEILARVKQNIKICNKNKIQMKFTSERYKRNPKDLQALGLVLGMPTWMTKNL